MQRNEKRKDVKRVQNRPLKHCALGLPGVERVVIAMGNRRNRSQARKRNKQAIAARRFQKSKIKGVASESRTRDEIYKKTGITKEKGTTNKPQRSSTKLHNNFNASHSGLVSTMSQVPNVLNPRIQNEDTKIRENVFTHYLAEDIDLKVLPFGWAPLLLPNKLQVLKVKDETVLMYVEVNRDKTVTLKMLNRKVPVPYSVPYINTLMSKCHAIKRFLDLVELLKKLDECFHHETVSSVNMSIRDSEVCTPCVTHDDDNDSVSTDGFPLEPISVKTETVESDHSSIHEMQDDDVQSHDSSESILPTIIKEEPADDPFEAEEISQSNKENDSTNNASQEQLYSVINRVPNSHYLATDFNIERFPSGWAPLFAPNKLQVFKIEDEIFVMYVEVTRDRKVFLKVLTEKLPDNSNGLVPKCSVVKCFMDLIQLLKKLDEWFVLIHRVR